MNKKIKKFLSAFLRIGLSGALLIFLFRKINIPKTLEILKEANFLYLFTGLILVFILYIFTLIRWNIIIQNLGIKVSFKSVTRCFFIGTFFNLFLPTSTGGDIVKTIDLFRETPEKTKVVASVLLDRLFGLITMISFAIVTFCIGYKLVYDQFLLISIVGVSLLTFLGVLFLFNERLYSFGCQIFNRFPKIKIKLMELHFAVVLIKEKPRALLSVILISCVVQFILASTFYLTAKGLHQDVSLLSCLIFVPLICLASAFPSIGGLGVREMGSVYLFAKVGVGAGAAASISLINFLFMTIIGLIGATIYVSSLSNRRVQRHSSDSEV